MHILGGSRWWPQVLRSLTPWGRPCWSSELLASVWSRFAHCRHMRSEPTDRRPQYSLLLISIWLLPFKNMKINKHFLKSKVKSEMPCLHLNIPFSQFSMWLFILCLSFYFLWVTSCCVCSNSGMLCISEAHVDSCQPLAHIWYLLPQSPRKTGINFCHTCIWTLITVVAWVGVQKMTVSWMNDHLNVLRNFCSVSVCQMTIDWSVLSYTL